MYYYVICITLHNRILCTVPARCLVAGIVLASLSFLHGSHRNQWREQLCFKDSQDMSYGSYDALWQGTHQWTNHRQRQNSPGYHPNLGQSRSPGTSSGPGLLGKALNFKDIAEVLIQAVLCSFVTFSSIVSCISQKCNPGVLQSILALWKMSFLVFLQRWPQPHDGATGLRDSAQLWLGI